MILCNPLKYSVNIETWSSSRSSLSWSSSSSLWWLVEHGSTTKVDSVSLDFIFGWSYKCKTRRAVVNDRRRHCHQHPCALAGIASDLLFEFMVIAMCAIPIGYPLSALNDCCTSDDKLYRYSIDTSGTGIKKQYLPREFWDLPKTWHDFEMI